MDTANILLDAVLIGGGVQQGQNTGKTAEGGESSGPDFQGLMLGLLDKGETKADDLKAGHQKPEERKEPKHETKDSWVEASSQSELLVRSMAAVPEVVPLDDSAVCLLNNPGRSENTDASPVSPVPQSQTGILVGVVDRSIANHPQVTGVRKEKAEVELPTDVISVATEKPDTASEPVDQQSVTVSTQAAVEPDQLRLASTIAYPQTKSTKPAVNVRNLQTETASGTASKGELSAVPEPLIVGKDNPVTQVDKAGQTIAVQQVVTSDSQQPAVVMQVVNPRADNGNIQTQEPIKRSKSSAGVSSSKPFSPDQIIKRLTDPAAEQPDNVVRAAGNPKQLVDKVIIPTGEKQVDDQPEVTQDKPKPPDGTTTQQVVNLQPEPGTPGMTAVDASLGSNGQLPPEKVLGTKIINQIVKSAKVNLIGDKADMALRLDPPHLGTVQMNVTVAEGTVRASIQTSTEAAKQVLQSDLSSLKQALTDAGVRVDSIQVSVGGDMSQSWTSQSGGHPQPGQGQFQHGDWQVSVPFMPVQGIETTTSAGSYIANGRINYLA